MRKLFVLLASLTLLACNSREDEISSLNPENWSKRQAASLPDSLEEGITYLSVYSQIYSRTEHITHDLTVTVSMRNTSMQDTIYLKDASYYDSHGQHIRSYFKNTIYIAPLETVEIVIDQVDQTGGTGGNFLFDWMIRPGTNEPLFESVAISTSSQQGLSFSTTGKRIE